MKVLKVINVIDFCQNRFSSPSAHSDLAMLAAKKMSKTRSKVKTGHKVCRHLLDMLAEDQTDSGFNTRLSTNLNTSTVKEDSFWFNAILTVPSFTKAENNGQISLSF